ncbi:MAG: PQQ-dependent sugar dehydrogenase [Gammaproteobacteria bacterium]
MRYLIYLILTLHLTNVLANNSLNQNSNIWKDDWALADDFNMTIDTGGYSLPSEIAFINNPGKLPSDPLYFVLELKGKLKVVTNDRTVHTYSENILPLPQNLDRFDPVGAAGLCLDQKHGYVYVTFAYLDENGVYRNGIIRYENSPGRIGISPNSSTYFLDLFKDEISHTSHQIGPCVIHDEELFIAVGFGRIKNESQKLESTLGSIIRMNLDFKPLQDNPFYKNDNKIEARDYIWAYGVRNVFGMKLVGNRLFVTENGGGVDKFNEIIKGENYLYDGSDWSFAAKAEYLFSPAVGLVHLDRIGPDLSTFPEKFKDTFFIVSSGAPGGSGPGDHGDRSIIFFDYDFLENKLSSSPQHLLKFRGKSSQLPVSIEFASDGLYFIPMFPNSDGQSYVFRITYDINNNYPNKLINEINPKTLVSKYGCRGCHIINGKGGGFGPNLDNDLLARLYQRLNSEDYENKIKLLDQSENDLEIYKILRSNTMRNKGEDRVRSWLISFIQEPSFDNHLIKMASVNANEADATILADYLLKQKSDNKNNQKNNKIKVLISRYLPEPRYRHIIFSFISGIIFSIIILIIRLYFKRK